MTEFPEQRLAALLRALPPAPAAWVAAAREIPRAEHELAHPAAPDLPAPEAQEKGAEASAGRDLDG
jgi:hypothetical protein